MELNVIKVTAATYTSIHLEDIVQQGLFMTSCECYTIILKYKVIMRALLPVTPTR